MRDGIYRSPPPLPRISSRMRSANGNLRLKFIRNIYLILINVILMIGLEYLRNTKHGSGVQLLFCETHLNIIIHYEYYFEY